MDPMSSKKPNKKILLNLGGIFLTCQALFISLHFLKASLPAENMKKAVTEGFNSGWLNTLDSDRTNRKHGIDAFSDCVEMQMAFNRSNRLLDSALGNLFRWWPDGTVCKMTQALANHTANNEGFNTYHRYWHGASTITSILISVFSVKHAQKLLLYLNYILFIFLFVLTYRWSNILFLAFLPFLMMGTFFSGVPVLGQSFLHSLPHLTWMIFLSLALLNKKRFITNPFLFEKWSLALGSFIVFFDCLNGGLLIGACIVLLFTFFGNLSLKNVKTLNKDNVSFFPIYRKSFLNLLIFNISWLGSICFKLALVLPFYGSGILTDFISNLKFRVSGFNYSSWDVAKALYDNLYLVGDGSQKLGKFLFFSALLTLSSTFLIQIVFTKKAKQVSKLLLKLNFPLYLGIAIAIARYFILKNHTCIHGFFMARFLYAPIAFCYASLILTLVIYQVALKETQLN